jgi:phosphoglucosamine mutase
LRQWHNMIKRKYFGTDGVRGLANAFPMTPDIALKLGAAAGRHFRKDQKQHRVVIGKDTRRSSYMFENALTAGFTSTGMDVYLLGPVPTPAVGVLTRSMRADVGVMISASHNSYLDNGIKFFGPEGFKLSDKVELEIEKLLDDEIEYAASQNIGMAKRIDDALGRYMEFAKSAFPRKKLLNGLKVVVDCANGAAYKAAPIVLWELGAEVISIGVNPDGYNINKDCGSTHPQNAAKAVLEHNADVGICLDGDADRLILIDNKGNIADGDQLMGLIASQWSSKGKLANNTLVATVMSNMGLERYLNTLDIKLLRTNVGDRYVVEAMRKFGYNLGGEQSGHIVMTDYATTGDGLMAALQFLNALVESKCTSSELIKVFEPMPQLLRNVRLNNSESLDNLKVKESIKAGEDAFGDIGRILIRKSGTEPLLRVMGECEDPKLLKAVIGNIVETVDAIN